MIKKIIWVLLISTLINTSFVSAYNEIDCSSDIVFESYSCNQCFEWWSKIQWDYIWLLIDDWVNISDKNQLLYKEAQRMPEMVNLDSNNVAWSQTPSAEWFWEYSDDFNALYSEENFWYILEAWNRVTWLQSKMWYAYKLDNNSATNNANIGLLMYPISTNIIQADWSVSIDSDEHIECVLFKSSWASEIVEPETPERLPDTWPTEYILLLIVAMLLWFGFMRMSSRS